MQRLEVSGAPDGHLQSVTIHSSAPRNFVGGGGITNSVEDRQNGDLGAVTPRSPRRGFWRAAVIWYKKFSFHTVKFS